MGFVVEYRCPACTLSSGRLSIGWGKAGRAAFWGGLAICSTCEVMSVVDLADMRPNRREHRCLRCNRELKRLEGMAERVNCPHCGTAMRHETLGSWA